MPSVWGELRLNLPGSRQSDPLILAESGEGYLTEIGNSGLYHES